MIEDTCIDKETWRKIEATLAPVAVSSQSASDGATPSSTSSAALNNLSG
eukprot:CAMPEP_0175013466 /NCGR_PEP_ID=MMETSP0005-20121125/9933_1 /TAXON_ID=420556 /ORGANISM="Ochromonas sp., Strain CCMP1393" /LENGTH=48 /DNA_ID= /DNA_START= /DNA_END= /DNA_ORIENTATION=